MATFFRQLRGFRFVAVAALVLLSSVRPAVTAELMPVAQQNALVQKYCAVCHTDAARNGGLSLQHFDAAQASPSLKAMLLSKLTGGVLLEMVRQSGSNPKATELVDAKMKFGAVGAAGIPQPDKAIMDAWIRALAVGSEGSTDWRVERGKGITASILREIPLGKDAAEAQVYRLIVSCDPTTRQGSMQLAWSPVAKNGTLAVAVDGKAASKYRVEASEKMGNGSGLLLHGAASWMLVDTAFPGQSLTVSDLFPGQTLTFPFASLPKDTRRELQACFSAKVAVR
ncbi:MAG TPA: hypothetical protein VER03_18090 [Bryobacteraceae bacterium]|nr:hypothetical protein [Bryobacteraceae bacterium]